MQCHSSSKSSITIGCSWVPVWIVLLFADLLDSEASGDDAIGEGGEGDARGIRRASAASAVNVGEAFQRGRDEVDELYDGGGRVSLSKIVTSLLDRTEPNEDVDELVSYGRRYG